MTKRTRNVIHGSTADMLIRFGAETAHVNLYESAWGTHDAANSIVGGMHSADVRDLAVYALKQLAQAERANAAKRNRKQHKDE